MIDQFRDVGLDPKWDRARELYAKAKAEMAPVFECMQPSFRQWPTFTAEERAHHAAQFLSLVKEEPMASVLWLECPNLPADLRAALEAML